MCIRDRYCGHINFGNMEYESLAYKAIEFCKCLKEKKVNIAVNAKTETKKRLRLYRKGIQKIACYCVADFPTIFY